MNRFKFEVLSAYIRARSWLYELWLINQSIHLFPQQRNFAMGLAQISSGAIRCSFNIWFWARFRRVPEGSGADSCCSGGPRCRCLGVPVQIAGEILEGSGAGTRQSSRKSGVWTGCGFGRFRCRYLVRLRRVPVPESSGVEAFGSFKG